ncbi:MAG: DUF2911 domain-containing protein [Cytophagales bacterium]|nr:DUF2911 domain-containing protein [Cytophagales bacterium]
MKPLNISFIFVCCALAISTHAQIEHPRISPSATLTQKVGLSEVKIEYSRPGVRGRKIVGDLIPYGRIWRVGANSLAENLLQRFSKHC